MDMIQAFVNEQMKTELPKFQIGDTVVIVDTNSREIIRQLNDIFA